MSTPKVGRAVAPSKGVPVQKTAAAPKTSFAETLAAKRAPKKAVAATEASTGEAAAAPDDPRRQAVMDKLSQSLLASALGVSKEKKLDQDKATGGLEGDE
ncbi:MAG: hypothetical protein HY791_21860 [Deltaproteobacteria bacterium]|nr:hypothetical protein [Deltaproteobacteria bacterium]